ncbi:unnamed protein product [Calypogeia fissa]
MEIKVDPASTLAAVLLGVVLCAVFTLLVFQYSSFWLTDPKSGAALPKGSFGWPFIGESIALLRDPLEFASSHRKRYGTIFKSNVFLRKTILGTTPEFARFVCLNEDLFKFYLPESMQFISPNSGFWADGPLRVALRKNFKIISLPESLQTMVQAMESIVLEHLASWEKQATVVGREATEKLIAGTSSYVALGTKNIYSTPEGRSAVENMLKLASGFGAIPINLPGTAYNKALKAREPVREYMKSIVEQRKHQLDNHCDLLRNFLNGREKARDSDEMKYYPDNNMIDDMVGSWFSAFKTTATTMTWTLKFLVDYPDIFRRIQAEQQEILKGKDLSLAGPRLTWEDLKKMDYTVKVFQEVQRSLSLGYLVTRRAAQDIVYDGVCIPKGWLVLPLLTYVHHDPNYYEDPDSFNPDRFDAASKPNTYIPFGIGGHRCPGEEVAKMIFLIFCHHLSTTYKYERVGPDQGKIYKAFFPQIIGGYPINVSRRI